MALAAGARLGPYEVLSAIGAGGMGEVYRARDTTLKRDVALKVLPDAFTLDPDRVARFAREAELLASLNHPNIAAIYGLQEADGVRALVLELIEGPTLADRLADGALPFDEALRIASQLCDALDAAHGLGIVHRDLKPANIKLRTDGTTKVLDLGLAKTIERSSAPDASAQPTVTSPAPTRAGIIVGTPGYMSPEQARGRVVDRRADIWAFGCVLYEMLTGRAPFSGETTADTVAAIVSSEPDWRALPHGTPPAIRSLIARCLRKDPAQRLRDIADARFQIEEVVHDPGVVAPVATPAGTARAWLPWIAAVVLLGTTLFFAGRSLRTTSSGDTISFPVSPREKDEFSARIDTTVNVPSFALAPDGRAVVFSAETPGARPMLWLRSLDNLDARQLPGTEGAQDPFWSPDSRWIGFFAEGTLRKVPAAGGAVQAITPITSDFRGATWGSGDTILVAIGVEGIVSVSAAGGALAPITTVDTSAQEDTHRNPSFLPDGRHFLYSVVGRADRGGVYLGSVDDQTKRRVLAIPTSAVYASPGYLLFVDGGTLLAQAFDPTRLELTGTPVFVADHVGRSTSFLSAVSASQAGTIAYAGPLARHGRLEWIDRRGNPIGPLGTPEGDYTDFRLSPDETRVAASLVDPTTGVVDIWITDLARGSTSRMTAAAGGAVTAAAVWSPDGTRLAFRSNRTGVIELYERSAAGGGVDRPLLAREAYRSAQSSLSPVPTDWSPDGGQIISSSPTVGARNDLWLLPLASGASPLKFMASAADEMHGNFSPDGRLVAYTSNESGKFEVYVETIPRSDRKWPVSTSGGYEPRWRADGREIYYLSDDRTLMAVAVGAGPVFGIPVPLFETRVTGRPTANRAHYVPGRDGQRFLVNTTTDTAATPITVVLNWVATLRR